ncbi:hypothetical protein GGF49_005356 [Coemansia sp. RSA 1853]|nr:hypothetical protein GGF49_005356 [Coemansia sp. RSA 1853]
MNTRLLGTSLTRCSSGPMPSLAPAMTRSDGHVGEGQDAADVVRVSKRFCCDDTELHVSFALAYALDRVATDMVETPEKYLWVPGSWPRDPDNIDMAAEIPGVQHFVSLK